MIKRIILILIFPFIVLAQNELHVDIEDLGNGDSLLTIMDNCQVKHQMILRKEDLGTDKALKWLQKLQKEGKIDSCLKSVDSL